MKKFIICLLSILIIPLCLLFSGCGAPVSSDFTTENNDRFVIVKRYNNNGASKFDIYVDKETRVMYLVHTGDNGYGITVMLNEDGSPMIYEGEF